MKLPTDYETEEYPDYHVVNDYDVSLTHCTRGIDRDTTTTVKMAESLINGGNLHVTDFCDDCKFKLLSECENLRSQPALYADFDDVELDNNRLILLRKGLTLLSIYENELFETNFKDMEALTRFLDKTIQIRREQ